MAKVRALTGIKKIGHAGTLDPLATGLLVLLIGPATQLQDLYMASVKEYSGTIKLGTRTASFDSETEVRACASDLVNTIPQRVYSSPL